MSTVPHAPNGQQENSVLPAARTAAIRFLDFLFEGMDAGFAEFRYLRPGRRRQAADVSSYLPLPLENEKVISEVLRRSGQQAIEIGLAPRHRTSSRSRPGKDCDVLEVGCVWATVGHRRAKGGVIEVMRRIRDFPLRPSVVVNNGYAHHVCFVLGAPLRDHLLLEWSDLMLELSNELQGGLPGHLSQTILLPGTLNLEEEPPIECAISEEFSSWTRYGIEEIRQAIKSTPVLEHPGQTTFSAEQLRQRGLDSELIEAVITGHLTSRHPVVSSGFGGESGRDFQIAYALFEHGFSEGEIKTIFRSHPHGCGSKLAQKREGERYLDSLLRKVTTGYHGVKMSTLGEGAGAGTQLMAIDLPPGYALQEDDSLWFHPQVSDESRKVPRPVKVCTSPLRITEIRENIDSGQISLVISFVYLGKTISAPILRSQMSDPRQLVAALSDVGAAVTSINARLVTAYLAACEHAFAATIPRRRVTSRFGRGRSGRQFFFPGLSTGIEFVPAGAGDAALYRAYAGRRGTLHDWLEALKIIARENLLIPQTAILAALVPPLQRKLQIPNFILDVHGNTSTGKSTSLRLAASIYGRPRDPDSLLLQWMNTSTAVEQVAAVCGELPIFLDDAQHCPAEVKRSVIYMIANGRGKGRGGGWGGVRETPTWHTVALSTSEEPLYEASPHEGARGRILSIGGITPPFRPGTAVLVQRIEEAVAANHGHAGAAYIRHLNGWTEQDWLRWQKRYSEIRSELLRSSSSDLVGRVSGYIAAVQLAGEVACPLLSLPFQTDVVSAWLMLHLDEQQSEQNMVLAALRALADYYVTNISHFAVDGHYDRSKRLAIQGVAKRGQYVGFLRSSVETVFKVHRWNMTAVLNKLAAAGVLQATEKDRHTKKVSVEGVQHRMVCIKWLALLPDDGVLDE